MAVLDWLMWQMSDSAFPIGGFAHSGGLEAAAQLGRISEGDSLEAFLKSALHQAAHSVAPFVAACHREPDRLGEWDAFYDATLSNHVANRASRAQGRAFIRIVSAAFPNHVAQASGLCLDPEGITGGTPLPRNSGQGFARRTGSAGCHVPRLRGHVFGRVPARKMRKDMPTQAWDMAPVQPAGLSPIDGNPPLLIDIARACKDPSRPAHFAPLLGTIGRTLGIALESTVRLYLFQTLRGHISAAVRLGLTGPVEGQAIQFRLSMFAETLVAPATHLSPENSAQTHPMHDLMQGIQDRLYSRLFQS